MELNTAASVIQCASRLEIASAEMYEKLGSLHKNLSEPFAAFARENIKNERRVKRAYYGVVSDALETGFCFKGLRANISIPEYESWTTALDCLNSVLTLETEITHFYEEAAHLSMALLPDVPRELKKSASMRHLRIGQLLAMIQSAKADVVPQKTG